MKAREFLTGMILAIFATLLVAVGLSQQAIAANAASGYVVCDYQDAPELCETQLGLIVPEGSDFAYRASADEEARLPKCDEEDGRRDGRACVWVDPDTGDRYYVDSKNYR